MPKSLRERVTVGYIRVSTREQAETKLSLDHQREKIEGYAKLNDIALSKIYDDAAESAKSLDRPAMLELLKQVEKGRILRVVIYKLDRMTRSVSDLGRLLELFDKRSVALSSVSESLDTSSASGRLVVNMMGSVAQWERETISERTRAALDVKRSRGEKLGGIAPYGFRAVGGRLVPDDAEFDIRKRILESRADGHGYKEMADQMNKTDIHPRSGKKWYASTVRSICIRGAAR